MFLLFLFFFCYTLDGDNMKDELSNSTVEQNNTPETQNETLTSTPEEVNTEVQQESVQNIDVINNEIIHEDKPKKSNKFTIVLIVLFIIGAIGGCVYYFNFMNNSKKDSKTSDECEGNICTTSKSTNTENITSGTRRADYELLNYLSRAPKNFNPFEGNDLLGEKYYKINLDEYTKCQDSSDVSFDYKNHKISYKCLLVDDTDDVNDPWYNAEGKVDNVNIKTKNTSVSCGTYEIYGSDDEVVIFETGNCDTAHGLGLNISFYSKDGKLKKEINPLYFSFQYQGLKYTVLPYIIVNSLYYVDSDNFSWIDDTEFDCKLHKLDLNSYEDTVIYNFKGKVY